MGLNESPFLHVVTQMLGFPSISREIRRPPLSANFARSTVFTKRMSPLTLSIAVQSFSTVSDHTTSTSDVNDDIMEVDLGVGPDLGPKEAEDADMLK